MTLQSVQMGTPDAVVIKRTTKVVDASTAVSKRINASATADADAVTAVTEDLAHSDVERAFEPDSAGDEIQQLDQCNKEM